MPLSYLDDRNYSGGVVRDTPSWELAMGEVYDSLNMIYDKPGVARTRGGTTAIFSGAQNSFAEAIQFCYSTDGGATIEELYGFSANIGDVRVINKTTGVATIIVAGITSGSRVGRGFRHFGFVIFPYACPSLSPIRGMIALGGVNVAASFTSATAVVLTAGAQQLTLGGADTTTNIKVGHVVKAQNATNIYYGRVVSIDTATTFTVWPKPNVTFTTTAAGFISNGFGGTTSEFGGLCGTSFQNRLLLGNTIDFSATIGTTPLVTDRRIYYSVLPTETALGNAAGTILTSGAAFLYASTQYIGLPFNYFDVPGADPIVGMEPLSDNELLILTSTHPVIFRGNLVTQLSTTSQQVTFDVSEMNVQAGCSNEHSIQRTPRGIMWAGVDGIFAYNGGLAENVLTGRMATYWRELARSSTFAVHGSAYIRGHYLVTGISGATTFALLCNLASKEVTFAPISNVDTFACVARPTNPSQVFAARWWVTTPVSMTNGSIIRLESMLDAYVANTTKTDADGVAVAFSITSRVLAGDPETQKIMQRVTVRYAAAMPAASVTVTGQSKIDAGDIVAASVRSLGTLSNSEARTINAVTNATPMVCTTTAVHGLQVGDFVDISAVLGTTNANGRARVLTVPSTTTFSLAGPGGNAAYISGGSVKKITETDFLASDLDQGQGFSFIVASSGTVNNFELHGLRLAMFQRDPVMSG